MFLFPNVLPKTMSMPKGFSKLKPFWVSRPPSGSRTMSTPAEDKQTEVNEMFMSHFNLIIKKQMKWISVNVDYYHTDLKGTQTLRRCVCFLTLGADFADFLHVVFGAVVDGMSYSAFGDGLVFGGWRRAKNGHIWHRLTQLGSSDTDPTCGHVEQEWE